MDLWHRPCLAIGNKRQGTDLRSESYLTCLAGKIENDCALSLLHCEQCSCFSCKVSSEIVSSRPSCPRSLPDLLADDFPLVPLLRLPCLHDEMFKRMLNVSISNYELSIKVRRQMPSWNAGAIGQKFPQTCVKNLGN